MGNVDSSHILHFARVSHGKTCGRSAWYKLTINTQNKYYENDDVCSLPQKKRFCISPTRSYAVHNMPLAGRCQLNRCDMFLAASKRLHLFQFLVEKFFHKLLSHVSFKQIHIFNQNTVFFIE